ncbi:hypothetical protein PD5205_01253 [Xanthomonas fragariae]|uniref:Uncharacterized protein n=1 Tax=Xanthomonas fragariae TaxID=48664 RepID=A0A1Y6HCH2_9XANT|nr:hypothetical protein PD885_02752 [Xanthomonas fragariae]SMR02566.1 hypothetical protein PD5205_01253 [Xanthomonas fragariae]
MCGLLKRQIIASNRASSVQVFGERDADMQGEGRESFPFCI